MLARCFEPAAPPPERAVGDACAFAGDRRLGVAAVTGSRLYGIDGAGTIVSLFEFGTDVPFEPGVPTTEVVESRGDYLAAALAFTPQGVQNPTEVYVELVVLDGASDVVFHEGRITDYKNTVNVTIHGNASGVFAFEVSTALGRSATVSGPAGERYGPFADLRVAADPEPDGVLAVRQETDFAWLDPCDGTIRPAQVEALSAYTDVHSAQSALLYVDAEAPAATLETSTAAMPQALPLVPPVTLALSHPIGWILAKEQGSAMMFGAANPRTGQEQAVSIQIPAGLKRFGSTPRFDFGATDELALTSNGQLLLGLRDAAVGRMYRTTSGSDWEPIGEPVGEVHRLEAIERAGTYLVRGTSLGQLTSDWAPAPPGVARRDYQQMQLVRPESGIFVMLYQAQPGTGFNRAYELSADGGCVARLRDQTLQVISAVTGQQHTLTLPVASQVYGDVTFVTDASTRFRSQ
jgi:hypothetical protein